MYALQRFSQSVVCLFILLTVSIEDLKIPELMNSNLLFFSFIQYASGITSKNSLPIPRL